MNYILVITDEGGHRVESDPMPFYAAQEVYARMISVPTDELHGFEGNTWGPANIKMGVAPTSRGLIVTIYPAERETE